MSTEVFPGLDDLLDQATAATGLSDFGSNYRVGLQTLIEAIREDVPVTAANIGPLSGLLLGLLTSRLYSESGWQHYPQSLAQPIKAPLVVTGLPRTGTTALHKLLSLDQQFQGLEQWLIGTPKPRPPPEDREADPHYRAAVRAQQAFLNAVPALRISHEVNADEVDECLNLLAQSFVSHYPSTGIGLPSYDRWWWRQEEVDSYRRYADNLRLIGFNASQRWLLKNPGHLTHLDALLAVFPDACIIQTHRDPAEVIPSVCSVIHPARCFFQAREVDATLIGPRELEFWARSEERATRVREGRPDRFFDVRFDQFQRQPMVVVEAIYAHFGLVLDPATEASMHAWIQTNSSERQGVHRYTLEQFGLSREGIRECFADYVARHQL